MMDRRNFVAASLAFSSGVVRAWADTAAPRFGHRQANMVMEPGQSVFELARKIPGLSGVQLQMIWKGADLSVGDLAGDYKRQAAQNGILVPSIAGIWKPGETIFQAEVAEKAISNAIRTAGFFGSKVILMALFTANCPDMSDEKSYGPVVALLQKMAPRAADAGVTLGLETSLTPADDRKLIGLVNHRGVRCYYDATNTEGYHPGEGVAGIKLLNSYIVECHLKNGDRLLNEAPSKVDWVAAIAAYRDIQYQGWYFFETEHKSAQRCIEDTVANIDFVKAQLLRRG